MLNNDLKVTLTDYHCKDLDGLAFLFPGQGGGFPKSFSSVLDIPIFKEQFKRADKLCSKNGLSSNLTDQKFDRLDEMSAAMMTNLFQFTLLVASFRYLVKSGKKPSLITAHSFGEFAALHCAGVIDFETAFKTIILREESSPQPNEMGNLVAISCSLERLNGLKLTQEYHLANENSPEQTVIAVPKKSLRGLLKALRAKRVAAKELKRVGRPYHSVLMKISSESFLRKLNEERIGICPLTTDFISSISGQLYKKDYLFGKQELIELLSAQFVKPVHFPNQINLAADNKIMGFLDLGLSEVLSNFVEDILDDESNYFVNYLGDLFAEKKSDSFSKKKTYRINDSKLFSNIASFVAKVTGYSLEEISIDHRFEDDLRIDSIKKAEILFHVLEANGLNNESKLELSNLRQVGDLVEYIDQRKSSDEDPREKRIAKFEVVSQVWNKNPFFFEKSLEYKNTFHAVRIRHLFRLEKFEKSNVVIFCNKFENLNPLELSGHLYKLIKEAGSLDSLFQICLIGDEGNPVLQALRSFLLCLRKEEFPFRLKVIYGLDPKHSDLIEQELSTSYSTEVKYLDSTRYTNTLSKADIESKTTLMGSVRNLFVVGGSRGILAHYLSNSETLNDVNVIFVGRSSIDSLKVQGSLNKHKLNLKSVEYLQCDVTNEQSILSTVRYIKKRGFEPELVIDGSGVEVSKLFFQKSEVEKIEEFNFKNKAVRNIQQAFNQEFKQQPKIIHFNSVSSRYGNAGQSIYAMSDAWCLTQKSTSHIVWPAIYKMGMTENLGILQKLISDGVDLLPHEKVLEFLEICVNDVLSSTSSGTYDVISLKDRLVLRLQLQDKEWVEEVLGEVSVAPVFSIKNTFDLNNQKFLSDHLISGKCIAPGCLGFASMYCLSQVYFNASPDVSDFKLKSLIPLGAGPVDTQLIVDFEKVSSLNLKIKSKLDNYSGVFTQSVVKKSINLDEGQEISFEMLMNDFYSDKYIPYGPAFKVLDSFFILSNNRCFAVHSIKDANRVSTDQLKNRISNITEAVFQTAGFLATWNDKVSLVPVRIGKLEHHNASLSDTLYIESSECRKLSQPERWVADLFVYNDQRQLCLSFHDVEGMRIKSYTSFPVNSVVKSARIKDEL